MIHASIIPMLAEASTSEGLSVLKVVLPWVTGFVTAVIAVVLKNRWKTADATGKRMWGFPRVDVRHVEDPPSQDRLRILEDYFREFKEEMNVRFREIDEALLSERSTARTAQGNLHKRIDALSERLGERLSKLEGTTEAVAENVSRLLNIAINSKG